MQMMQINEKVVKENLGAIIDAGYISKENYKEVIEAVGGVNNLRNFKPTQLQEMVKGLKEGLTVAQVRNYADPNKKSEEMQRIRQNLVQEQKNIPEELKQLKDFLTLAADFGSHLVNGDTVEDLSDEIQEQKRKNPSAQVDNQMDALAYISAKLGIVPKVPTVHERIQQMKTKNRM